MVKRRIEGTMSKRNKQNEIKYKNSNVKRYMGKELRRRSLRSRSFIRRKVGNL
jgi:hypothetical protein